MVAYRLKTDSKLNGTKAGTIVYLATVFDYGLASDDTRHFGIEHVSVSLKHDGDYPFFTHPLHELEALPKLPMLTEQHVKDVCLP